MDNRFFPLISVIIPTYNHGNYLGRALQSVKDQTYTNWELIVIDNHSTDNTDEVIASFYNLQIKYLKIHNNGVIAASRNTGINMAKGEWISFLDSDDMWSKDKLQVCVNYIDDETDLLYHDMSIIPQQKNFFKRKMIKSRQLRPPVLEDLLVNSNIIINSSVVVRKNLLDKIGGIDESIDMIAAEDYNTWLRISKLTNQFVYLPYKLGFYLIQSQNISKTKDMSVPSYHAVFEFLNTLNMNQRKIVKANLKYMSGRFNYLSGNLFVAKKKLIFSLFNGRIDLKIKSAVMLILIFFIRCLKQDPKKKLYE